MKNFICALFLLFLILPASASHIASGDLTYTYTGNANFPHRYEVSLIITRDTRGTTIGTSVTIDYTSSCFSGGNLSLTLQPGTGIGYGTLFNGQPGDPFSCVSSASFDPNIYEYYVYKETVNLPGFCNDWKFSYTLCCRNGAIANISNPASYYFYIDAHLNNNAGNNSSPVFNDPPGKGLCVNPPTPFKWRQNATDPDGDSLFYRFSTPLNTYLNPVLFAPGYSESQPIIANSPSSIDPVTGMITLDPAQVEENVVKITVEEYRLDSATGVFQLIGDISRENILITLPNCSYTPFRLSGNDTALAKVPVIASCGDSTFRFYTGLYFESSSLAHNGSDFVLYRNNSLIPIVGAHQTGTREIELTLHDTVSFNDTLHLVSVVGHDGNTLIQECGYELEVGDSITVVFQDCSGLGTPERVKTSTTLFPNPVSDKFTIEFPDHNSERNIQVLDLNGKIIMRMDSEAGEKSISAFTGNLPQGVYLVKIMAGIKTETLRFVKN